MRLVEDHTKIVHRVAPDIEDWLRKQDVDGKRVNTVTLCHDARVGILDHKDGHVTCIACATGKWSR